MVAEAGIVVQGQRIVQMLLPACRERCLKRWVSVAKSKKDETPTNEVICNFFKVLLMLSRAYTESV